MLDRRDEQAQSNGTRRQLLKPFGADRAHALMMKTEALATMDRQECFNKGYLSVKDLDDEELRYGRCRDRNGFIPKNKLKTELIPKEQYDAMIAEHEARFNQKLRQNLDDMLEIMISIAKDETVEPRDRFDAAKYLMERVVGKTPTTVNVSVTAKPWEELLGQVTGIAPMSRAEHRAIQGAGIVDAEVVEDQADNQTEDDLQPEDIPEDGQNTAEQDVVQVHQPRPGEQDTTSRTKPVAQDTRTIQQATYTGEAPEPGEPYDEYVPLQVGQDVLVRTDNAKQQYQPVERVDEPDAPELNYGRRADEKRSYKDQVRDAEALAKRRKERKEQINQARKIRKVTRAMGADAIKDDITGATIAEDGKLTFD